MTKRIVSLTSAFLVAVGLAVYTGSALAGNGNGNGNGDAAIASGGPGNAENAPGQAKKDEASTDAKGGGSADQNADASQSGVKPTNATAKGTTCGPVGGSGSGTTCAPTGTAAANAQSSGKADASKRYGNDKTAAQVAVTNGASGVSLYGPGNSQPHKAGCPGSTKMVDVHALKGKKLQCGTSTAPGTTGSNPNTSSKPNVPTSANQPTTGATVSGGVAGATTTAGAGTTAAGSSPTGGVLGTTSSGSSPAGGVLGAIEAVGQGSLPFTGFPLWVAVAFGLGLVAFGLTLRRRGRVTV
jgi:hypothetical protein